jgi:hypothetical protein
VTLPLRSAAFSELPPPTISDHRTVFSILHTRIHAVVWVPPNKTQRQGSNCQELIREVIPESQLWSGKARQGSKSRGCDREQVPTVDNWAHSCQAALRILWNTPQSWSQSSQLSAVPKGSNSPAHWACLMQGTSSQRNLRQIVTDVHYGGCRHMQGRSCEWC